MDKRLRDLKRLAKRYGLEVVLGRRSCHYRLVDSTGHVVAIAAASASDHRAMKKLESDLKRSVQSRPLAG